MLSIKKTRMVMLMMTGAMIQVLGPVGSGSFVRWIDQAIFRATTGKKLR